MRSESVSSSDWNSPLAPRESPHYCSPSVRERVFGLIEDGHKRSVSMILRVREQSSLLANQPVLAESIRLRNPYVDPLNYIQIRFLRLWRRSGPSPSAKTEPLRRLLALTVHGIAFGMKSIG